MGSGIWVRLLRVGIGLGFLRLRARLRRRFRGVRSHAIVIVRLVIIFTFMIARECNATADEGQSANYAANNGR